jgi:hypothetical protein
MGKPVGVVGLVGVVLTYMENWHDKKSIVMKTPPPLQRLPPKVKGMSNELN